MGVHVPTVAIVWLPAGQETVGTRVPIVPDPIICVQQAESASPSTAVALIS